MRKFLLYMLLLSVSLPAIAAENEFKFGVTTNTRYNDNVNNVESDKVDAVVFQIGPRLRFDRRDAKYEATLQYLPRYTTYTDGERANKFIQYLGANGEFRLTSRITLDARNNLSVDSDADRDITDGTTVDLDPNDRRKQVLRNDANLGLRYSYSQRGTVSLDGGYYLVDRDDRDLSDVGSASGRLQTTYAVTTRTSLGTGVSVTSQEIEESRQRDPTRTNYYGLFLQASHQFDPMFSITASAGPTWLRSKRKIDGEHENDLNYFARAIFVADFESGSVEVEYGRENSEVSFSPTSYIIDEVAARLGWQVTSRVTVGLRGEWNRREAVLDLTGVDFVEEVEQRLAAADVRYRMTPEVVAGFSVDYLQQKTDASSSAVRSRTVDRVRAIVRFEYNAEALRF